MFRIEALGPEGRMKFFDSVHEMEILVPVLFHVHCVWHGPGHRNYITNVYRQ